MSKQPKDETPHTAFNHGTASIPSDINFEESLDNSIKRSPLKSPPKIASRPPPDSVPVTPDIVGENDEGEEDEEDDDESDGSDEDEGEGDLIGAVKIMDGLFIGAISAQRIWTFYFQTKSRKLLIVLVKKLIIISLNMEFIISLTTGKNTNWLMLMSNWNMKYLIL